jgi:hypothetical protein
MLLTAFPTGIPRYAVGMIYIPVVLVYVPFLKRGLPFVALLLLAIFWMFPFLDQFRAFTTLENIRLKPLAEFFYAVHFDAYENFASAVEIGWVSYGMQLVGVLLFFFPRSLWPDKPIGSGSQVAIDSGYEFYNIAMPLLGEGYVNFGFAGVLIFSLVLVVAMQRTDDAHARAMAHSSRISYLNCLYFYLVGALLFVLRGDLLSSYAYTISGAFVYHFVKYGFLILNKRLAFKKNFGDRV